MVHFLYELFPGIRVRKHFTIRLGKQTLVYAYVRKNACSAFKKLFVGESLYAEQCPACDPLGLMGRFHKTRGRDLLRDDVLTMAVLRDPYARLVSLYLNKFIVRSGNEDIFANYARLTGRNPEKATFHDFLTGYVDRFSFRQLDCHLIPQVAHLGHFVYNSPVRFEFLFDDLKRALGEEYAEKYFRKKINATVYADEADDSGYSCITPPNELTEVYKKTGRVPSHKNFMCDALENTIKTRYSDDLVIVESLNSDYLKCHANEMPLLQAHIPMKRVTEFFR